MPLPAPPPPGEKKKPLPSGGMGKPPPVTFDAPAPPQAKMGGFLEENLDDAWNLAKSLVDVIPALVNRVGEIAKDPKQYAKDFNLLFGKGAGNIGDVTSYLVDDYTKVFKEHGVKGVTHRIPSRLLDLATLFSGAGIAVGSAGKIAQATGAGERALRLIKAGEYLERLPGMLARKAVDKSVLGVSGGKLDLAKRRDFLRLKAEERGRASVELQKDLEGVGKKIAALSDDEGALFHKWRSTGAMPEEAAMNPKVRDALEAYRGLAKKWQEEYRARNVLTPEAAEEALAKKYALEAFGSVGDDAIARAKAGIEALRKTPGAIAPVYGRNVFPKAQKSLRGEDLLDDMITGGKYMREGKVGALEEMKGAKGYIKDPRVYVLRSMQEFRESEAKFRLSERLLSEPKLIAGKAEGATPETLRIPEGVYRKYYEDTVRAEALRNITDPTIKRLLRWEYIHTQHGLVRLYDRFLGLFSKMATRWNPRWYTGNAVGDAVLGTLAGSSWLKGREMLRKGAMPSQIRAKLGMGSIDEAATATPGLGERAVDLVNDIDIATRAGIITKEVGRRLKLASLSFEGSAATLEQVLRSTDQFSEVQVRLRLLEESVARRSIGIRKYDTEIAKLHAQEAAKAPQVERTLRDRYNRLVGQAHELWKRNVASRERLHPRGYLPGTTPGGPRDALKAGERIESVSARINQNLSEAAKVKKLLDRMEVPEELQTLRQKILSLETERDAVLRDLTDDLVKSGELEKLVPGLRQQVEIVRSGVDRANAFVGDYLGLDGFEQNVMRRLIPFYPWTKAMTMLAFRLPFLAPVKTFLWHRYAQAMMTLMRDPELPEDFQRGRLPLFAMKDGKIGWLKVSGYGPFEALRTSKIGKVPVPAAANLVERNPVLGLGFRLFGGKTEFDTSDIPFGEKATFIPDGTLVKFTADGKIEKDINQTPLVAAVVSMFPAVQYAKAVMMPYWTNKHNWAGIPEPILNPDGSYRFPRELVDRAGALAGLSLQTRSKEDIQRSNRTKTIQAMKSLEKKYLRADPEEREFIREAMRDYSRGLYREFTTR